MPTPRVGMALIVRDEADSITRCLDSFWPHVDRVAILDTGSTDGTVEVIRTYAERRLDAAGEHERLPQLAIDVFEWCDDFAAARNKADELLVHGHDGQAPEPLVDWTCWIDADDVLIGGENLRALAAQAPPGAVSFGAGYDYARDSQGTCVCWLRRERLVRAEYSGRWAGRVHEAQSVPGDAIHWVDPDTLLWRHMKDDRDLGKSSDRNRGLLHAWAEQEPHNSRVCAYLGAEYAGMGDVEKAEHWFRRYMELDTIWPEERAQVHRRLAACLIAAGRLDDAEQLALQALPVHPQWPDSYLTLAEVEYARGRWEHAAAWADRVLQLGEPKGTLLIVNPIDYTVTPTLLLGGARAEMGDYAEALQLVNKVGVPNEQIAAAVRLWQSRHTREKVALQVIQLAQTLVGHDEQQAARNLLETAVPYFVRDHPEVVKCRSQLRERLLWVDDPDAYAEHYEVGGSKPEDFTDDETAVEIAGRLPRSHFLLAGLLGQLSDADASLQG